MSIFARLLARLGYVKLKDRGGGAGDDSAVISRARGRDDGGSPGRVSAESNVPEPASNSEPAPRTPRRRGYGPSHPERTIEIHADYAATMALALADTDRQPRVGPRRAEPIDVPMDWAEGTRDEHVTPRLTPIVEDETTNRRRAAPLPPWIASEEDQTTGMLLRVGDGSQPPLVLPDDEVIVDFEEALSYLEVGDSTSVSAGRTRDDD